MRELEIRTWVKQLGASFKAPLPEVDVRPLQALYKERNYTAMTGYIQTALRLSDISLSVGYVKSGGPAHAVAWVETPLPMPAYGSPAFKQLRVPMYIRKEFLENVDFPLTVMAISHELCHVVLNSIGHSLKHVEQAVDLTAMYLGFRHVFIAPNVAEFHPDERGWLQQRLATFLGDTTDKRELNPLGSFGYMSFAERKFAAELMGTFKPFKP